MPEVKTFVSYSWGVEKTTGIVDEIGACCEERGIKFIRDESAMQHGDVIMDFMNDLASGDHIITVFSKPYFKSIWCMYELLKIWEKGDFKGRTHAMFADDCDLQNTAYRIEIVKYWISQHQEITELLDGVDPALLGKEYERANMIRDISQKCNELINFAAGRLTTPLADLKARQYSQILDRIKELEDPVSDSSETPDVRKKRDQVFMDSVTEGLGTNLKRSPVYLSKLCDKFGAINEKSLAQQLIEQCLQAEFRPIVNKMQASFKEAWADLSSASVSERNALLDSADSVLSHLVLFNVREEWLSDNTQMASQRDYTLPKLRLVSANVALSRLVNVVPSFQKNKESVGTKSGASILGNALQLESGVKQDQALPLILRMLAASLMPDRDPFPHDTEELAEEINEVLSFYRGHEEQAMRRRTFIMLPQTEMTDDSIYAEINRLLPDIAWVSIDVGGDRNVFLTSDIKLKTDIEQFCMTLEGESAS